MIEGRLTTQRSEGAVSSARDAGVEQLRPDVEVIGDDPPVAICSREKVQSLVSPAPPPAGTQAREPSLARRPSRPSSVAFVASPLHGRSLEPEPQEQVMKLSQREKRLCATPLPTSREFLPAHPYPLGTDRALISSNCCDG